MPKHGKKYLEAMRRFDHNASYTAGEAVDLVKVLAPASFDETVEVAFRLGIDPRRADQMVRGTVSLPHGTGKAVRVAVFAQADKAREAVSKGTEEAERRPEQQPEPDEPDYGRKVLDLVHGADDRRDLALREHPGQLPDEIRRFVGATEQPEQRHGEERQRHEREQRVVRDHRGELRATVGLELHEQLALPDAHRQE